MTVFLGTLWCSIEKNEAPYLSDSELWIALTQCMEIKPHTRRGICVMGFLELRQEPGVYSQVTAGMAIRNSTLFREVRTPA